MRTTNRSGNGIFFVYSFTDLNDAIGRRFCAFSENAPKMPNLTAVWPCENALSITKKPFQANVAIKLNNKNCFWDWTFCSSYSEKQMATWLKASARLLKLPFNPLVTVFYVNRKLLMKKGQMQQAQINLRPGKTLFLWNLRTLIWIWQHRCKC